MNPKLLIPCSRNDLFVKEVRCCVKLMWQRLFITVEYFGVRILRRSGFIILLYFHSMDNLMVRQNTYSVTKLHKCF